MNLKNILHKYLIKEISSEDAMSAIKNDIKNDEYNNAALYIKIGKMEKKVSWTDLEGLIDGFDISDKIVAAGGNYLDELKNVQMNLFLIYYQRVNKNMRMFISILLLVTSLLLIIFNKKIIVDTF